MLFIMVRQRMEEQYIIMVEINYLDFSNTKDCIKMRYEVNCDGKILEEGEMGDISIEPQQSAMVKLPVSVPEKGSAFLKIYYYSSKATPLVPEGHLLGFDEVALENADGRNAAAVQILEDFGTTENEIKVEENNAFIFLEGNCFSYCLDKRTGLFTKLTYKGVDQISQPMEINIWRAPTDNDMYMKAKAAETN